jgi:chorismate mutase/prephenate dehydratase
MSVVQLRVERAGTSRVGYPGREGSHTATAAEALFAEQVELVALPTFTAVADAAAGGEVDAGVLPIESSLVGPVAETHDLLYRSPLAISAETIFPINHCLVGIGRVAPDRISTVVSHPVALDQCRELVASMPWATVVAAATTADAAHEVAERADPTVAAIASEHAAHLYGLNVLAANVGDHPEAYTRFVSVAPFLRLDRPGGDWRTAFSFQTDHRPGALHAAIAPFAVHAIDLALLVSRPIPQTPWRYRFDAVLHGHPLDPEVTQALRAARRLTASLRVFGSYPAAAPPEAAARRRSSSSTAAGSRPRAASTT